MDFDCDVPPDRHSSVTGNLTAPLAIAGTVEAKQLRAGNNLPVAGARLVSSDGKESAGFQLVAASAQAQKFDVVLNLNRNGKLQRTTLGQIPVRAPIPFRLTLSEAGTITLSISANTFDYDFIPLPAGKVMAFCSTGQFKFTNLIFSNDKP